MKIYEIEICVVCDEQLWDLDGGDWCDSCKIWRSKAREEIMEIEVVPHEEAVRSDGESWRSYAHRLETRIKEQREQLHSYSSLRGTDGNRTDRKRIAHLERVVGTYAAKAEEERQARLDLLAHLKDKEKDEKKDEVHLIEDSFRYEDLESFIDDDGKIHFGRPVVKFEMDTSNGRTLSVEIPKWECKSFWNHQHAYEKVSRHFERVLRGEV